MLAARSNKIAKEELKDFNAAFEYREIERSYKRHQFPERNSVLNKLKMSIQFIDNFNLLFNFHIECDRYSHIISTVQLLIKHFVSKC